MLSQINFLVAEKPENINPMVRAYGLLEPKQKCKKCKYLYGKQYSKVYYKCELRSNTNGSATDHRVNWPACKKFEYIDE